MQFRCPRTCPLVGAPWCRFRPVLDALGETRVSSHTVTVKVTFTDPEALRFAVQAMGGTWLGQGRHHLYGGDVSGHGFTLPGWTFPLVWDRDAGLFCDDYGGRWGDVRLLETLKSHYALAQVEASAAALGWQSERTAEGILTVYHPDGGVLTYANGDALATGFEGRGCHDALTSLMQGAGLAITSAQPTAEYSAVAAQVQIPSAGQNAGA